MGMTYFKHTRENCGFFLPKIIRMFTGEGWMDGNYTPNERILYIQIPKNIKLIIALKHGLNLLVMRMMKIKMKVWSEMY